MLPTSFYNYFLRLDKVHSYNTRQKTRNVYFQSFTGLETEKNASPHVSEVMGDIFKCIGTVFFPNLKSIAKQMYSQRFVPLFDFFHLVYCAVIDFLVFFHLPDFDAVGLLIKLTCNLKV